MKVLNYEVLVLSGDVMVELESGEKAVIELYVEYKDEIKKVLKEIGLNVVVYEEYDEDPDTIYAYEVVHGWRDNIEVYCYYSLDEEATECWLIDYGKNGGSKIIRIGGRKDLSILSNELRKRLK